MRTSRPGETGARVCCGRSCGTTWSSRAETVILLCGRGEQVCKALNECLWGSITLAAASHSARALCLGFVMVLSLIWGVSKGI